MIVYLGTLLPLSMLILAIITHRRKEVMWFWHLPINENYHINKQYQITFNTKLANSFVLMGIIQIIPCLLYIFNILNQHKAFMLLCIIFTITTLLTIFYWHSLYKAYFIKDKE